MRTDSRLFQKFIMLALLTVAVAVATSACGGGDEERGEPTATEGPTASEEEVKIAFFPFSFDNVYIAAAIDEYRKQAQSMEGVEVELFDGRFDTETQLGQMRDAIASGDYDGFIIAPVDGIAAIPVIEDAIDAGIEVICTESPCGPDPATIEPQIEGQLAYTSINGADDGAVMADLIADGCEGKDRCKVAFIQGFATNTTDQARFGELKKRLQDMPNVTLAAVGEGKFEQGEAYRVMQNIIQAHPDLDGLATAGDQMTFGAEQAVKEAGRTPGKDIFLIGNASSEEGLEAICAGRWLGAPAYLPRTTAEVSLDIMVRTLRGEEGLGSVDTRTLSPVGPAVTKDACGKWDAEWSITG